MRWLRWGVRLAGWIRPCELQATLLWAGLVGFLGGLISLGFRQAIHGVQWLLTGHSGSLVQIALDLPPWQRLLVPTVGGLLAGLALQLGARLTRGQPSTDFMEAVVVGDGIIRSRSSVVKSVSSLLTIASGGSIGREGPMVQLAAMLASWLGRLTGLSTARLRLLVACGAAAGIAAAYNAPIAGSLFVAEIVLGSIAMESFGPLVFAAVISALTCRQLFGADPVFRTSAFQLVSPWEVVPYLGLGIMTGVAAPWFLRLLRGSEKLFAALPLPPFARLGLGGLLVGSISLHTPQVWGNGDTVVNSILLGEWLWPSILVILLAKLMATTATVGSGAVGGVFTPTLFMGAALGCVLGQAVHPHWPDSTGGPQAYALVGMGSFLAATTRAPLMSILMLFEMTLDYDIVLPLMLACVTAFYTARGIEKDSIYAASLRRKQTAPPQPWSQLRVSDLMKPSFPCVPLTAPFTEVTKGFVNHPTDQLGVVTGDNQFCGVVWLHDVKAHLQDAELGALVTASDLVRDGVPVLTPQRSLMEAMDQFTRHDGDQLPVVNNPDERKLVGCISKSDLLLTLAHGVDWEAEQSANGE